MGRSWDTLLNYESQELVRKRHQLRHGRDANAGRASEVAACFTQGREYFASAERSDRVVRPLLLYYGAMSLARGTLLFLTPGAREASLSPSHGVSVLAWPEVFAQPSPDLASLRVRVNANGTLVDFATATGCRSLLRLGSSAVNHKWEHSQLAAGQELTLGDLTGRIPELMAHHRRWKGEVRCCFASVMPGTAGGPTARVNISRSQRGADADSALVASVLRGVPHTIVDQNEHGLVVEVPNKKTDGVVFWDWVPDDALGIGSSCAVARLDNGADLSKPVTILTLAYVLGMLVRYYPSQWTGTARGAKHDAALPTLLTSMSLIERLFPQMILDFLEEA